MSGSTGTLKIKILVLLVLRNQRLIILILPRRTHFFDFCGRNTPLGFDVMLHLFYSNQKINFYILPFLAKIKNVKKLDKINKFIFYPKNL